MKNADNAFDAKPLTARQWIRLLRESNYVLRISDGTGNGTFRFWSDGGQTFWRCLNWTARKPADEVDLDVCLDGDTTTQLLIGGQDGR